MAAILIFSDTCFSKDNLPNILELHIHYFVNQCYQTKGDAEKYGAELKKRIAKAIEKKSYPVNVEFITHVIKNDSGDIRQGATVLVEKYEKLINGQNISDREVKHRLIDKLITEEKIPESALLLAYYYTKYGEYPLLDASSKIDPSFYNNVMILIGSSGRDVLRMINEDGVPHMAIFLHGVPITYSEFSSFINVNHIKVVNFYCDEKAPFLGYDVTSAAKLNDEYQRYNLYLKDTDDMYTLGEKNSKVTKFIIEAEAAAISDALDLMHKIAEKEKQSKKK